MPPSGFSPEKIPPPPRDLYKSGRANYLEVLLAQQNALQAQLEVVEVRCRQRVAEVNLYRSLGGGWK